MYILCNFLEGFSFMVRDLHSKQGKGQLEHLGCSDLVNPHHSAFPTSGHACPALNHCLILLLFLTIIQNILQNTGRCRHSLTNSPGLGCWAGRRGHRASSMLWAPSEWEKNNPGRLRTEAHHSCKLQQRIGLRPFTAR